MRQDKHGVAAKLEVSPWRKALPPAIAAVSAFAGGWFLRGPVTADAPSKSRTLTVTAGPIGVVAPEKENFSETGLPPAVIRPIESLQEILDAIAVLKSEGEVGAISMLELLPRLMVTDLITVRRLIGELNEHPNSGDEMFIGMKAGLMFRWLMLQPAEAIGYSLAHPTMFGNMEEINLVGIAYLAKTNPEAAKGMAAMLPGETEEQAKEFLEMMNAMSNPEKFLTDPEKLAKLDQGKIERLAGKWMVKEPQNALSWFRNLPAEKQTPNVVSGMASAWFATDRSAALAWMAGLPEDQRAIAQNGALGNLHRGVRDEASLEQRMTGLPPAMRDRVRLNWYGDHRNNPAEPVEKTAAAVKDLLASGTTGADGDQNAGTNAARRVGQMYGNGDKQAEGGAWIASLPEGSARDTAADQFTRAWANKDAGAASEWITGLPQGPTRDSAAKSLIDEIRNDDPEAALVWAASLSTEEQQLRQSREIYTHWITKDPLKALSALQAVPADQQVRIFGGGNE